MVSSKFIMDILEEADGYNQAVPLETIFLMAKEKGVTNRRSVAAKILRLKFDGEIMEPAVKKFKLWTTKRLPVTSMDIESLLA